MHPGADIPVIAFIDGLNLQHGMERLGLPHLMWLDVCALMRRFLASGERLTEVRYYTSHPGRMSEKAQRLFRARVRALEAAGAVVIPGKFKPRQLPVPAHWRAQNPALPPRLLIHEEKETDVRIAVDMTAAAYERRAGRILLTTTDGDLRPVAEKILRDFPAAKIALLAPPKSKGHRAFQPFAREFPARFRMESVVQQDLACSRLPEVVEDANGRIIECPPQYSRKRR